MTERVFQSLLEQPLGAVCVRDRERERDEGMGQLLQDSYLSFQRLTSICVLGLLCASDSWRSLGLSGECLGLGAARSSLSIKTGQQERRAQESKVSLVCGDGEREKCKTPCGRVSRGEELSTMRVYSSLLNYALKNGQDDACVMCTHSTIT